MSRMLIVGLAPGLHGANRSGKPFTGDDSGRLLHEEMAELGWGTESASRLPVRITNALKCVPPKNSPNHSELSECRAYLSYEIDELMQNQRPCVILALGRIAHDAVIKTFGQPLVRFPFGHKRRHDLEEGVALIDSYHCSRYNIQTRRLDRQSFRSALDLCHDIVWEGN